MPAVCFVCLGNICRSPMASAIMKHLVAQDATAGDWLIESAGTGHWHVGKGADPRTVAVCTAMRVPCEHRARQVARSDFTRFDWLLAMDEDNLANLRRLAPRDASAELALLGDFDPEGRSEVPDPYYGGDDGFERVYEQVLRCCRAFLAHARR